MTDKSIRQRVKTLEVKFIELADIQSRTVAAFETCTKQNAELTYRIRILEHQVHRQLK